MKYRRGSNQFKTRRHRSEFDSWFIFRCFMAMLLTLLLTSGYFKAVTPKTAQAKAYISPIPTSTVSHNSGKPKREAVSPTPTIQVDPQYQDISAYIHEVFGSYSDRAILLLSCENHSLNPVAHNINTDEWSSGDWGVFQINDHWQGVTNKAFLTDYKINVQMAYSIFSRDGYSFKLWTCGRKLGI